MQTDNQKSTKRARRIAVLVGILGVSIGAAVILNLYGVLSIFGTTPRDEVEVDEEEVRPLESEDRLWRILRLDPAIVERVDNGERYLKVAVEIEVPDDEDVVKQIEARKRLLHDTLIEVVAGKAMEEIMSVEGRDLLQNEIAEQFRKELGNENLKAVYISELLPQDRGNDFSTAQSAR